MSTFERVDVIIRLKQYEANCAMRRELMVSESNLEALRKTRAEIEAKMKGGG